ncbi:MAG: hypothetical protein KAQ85_07115 [Thermodesulfovibrionia bacterium]|nr:hypothetical protein [Thermodesulfovibrionia bacterium]
MVRHPLVAFMQHVYTRKKHVELRKKAKKIEVKLPDIPTVENPDFIVNEDYVHSLAGTVQMGAAGFDTFGMGSGHQTARSLWDARSHEISYNYEGDERINTAAMVWSNLNFKTDKAILANSLFQVFVTHIDRSFYEPDFEAILPLIEKILESFFKNEKDKDYEHINTDSVKSLFKNLAETKSYYRDCELMVEFITNSDYSYTRYTANNEDNDLIQDIHYTEDGNEYLTGLYFHTGCDVRCGFSSPIFGTQSDDRLQRTASGLYYRLEEKFGKDYEHQDLAGFLQNNGVKVPYSDQGSMLTYFLREKGWIEIVLNEEDRIGERNRYYTDREVVLTQKAIEFINKHNPRQQELDQFFKE